MINKREIEDFCNALTEEGEAMRVFYRERHRPLDDVSSNDDQLSKSAKKRTDIGMSTRNTLSP
jgi:hypothetical protein